MAVSLSIAELSAAIRVGNTDPEKAEVTRLLGYAQAEINRFATQAIPQGIENEAAVRIIGYLYDAPTTAYANVLTNSGAAAMLLPYRVHRGGNVIGAAAVERTSSSSGDTVNVSLWALRDNGSLIPVAKIPDLPASKITGLPGGEAASLPVPRAGRESEIPFMLEYDSTTSSWVIHYGVWDAAELLESATVVTSLIEDGAVTPEKLASTIPVIPKPVRGRISEVPHMLEWDTTTSSWVIHYGVWDAAELLEGETITTGLLKDGAITPEKLSSKVLRLPTPAQNRLTVTPQMLVFDHTSAAWAVHYGKLDADDFISADTIDGATHIKDGTINTPELNRNVLNRLTPTPTSQLNGKILTVKSGVNSWENVPTEIPASGTDDNGKVLGVVAGKPAWVDAPSGGGGATTLTRINDSKPTFQTQSGTARGYILFSAADKTKIIAALGENKPLVVVFIKQNITSTGAWEPPGPGDGGDQIVGEIFCLVSGNEFKRSAPRTRFVRTCGFLYVGNKLQLVEVRIEQRAARLDLFTLNDSLGTNTRSSWPSDITANVYSF